VSIEIVTYSYVEPSQNPPTCALESVSADVESYLLSHVASLLEGAAEGSSPPARFQSADGRDRFDVLLDGSDSQFLQAAEQVAQRLFKEMDNRAKAGFFVAMRSSEGQRMRAAVLKLDIHARSGASMSRTGPGRPTLEAVRDLLDIPGQLQKGAVFRDDRGGSDIVVGDKLTETALYFLRAIDVIQMSKSGQAVSAVVNAVAKVAGPQRAVPVIRALEKEQETSPEDFFARHSDLLDEQERVQVFDQLRVRKRPVDRFDARQHVLDEIITADGITVRGRATTIADKLDITKRPGGWRIQIDLDEEPQHEFR
jgi:hypothetical protein